MIDFRSLSRFPQCALTVVGLLLVSATASGQKDPLLSFGIDGLAEGDTIYLANYYGNKMYYADTATVGKKGLSLIHI